MVGHYICVSAHIEHFLWYRQETRHKIEALLMAGPPGALGSQTESVIA